MKTKLMTVHRNNRIYEHTRKDYTLCYSLKVEGVVYLNKVDYDELVSYLLLLALRD